MTILLTADSCLYKNIATNFLAKTVIIHCYFNFHCFNGHLKKDILSRSVIFLKQSYGPCLTTSLSTCYLLFPYYLLRKLDLWVEVVSSDWVGGGWKDANRRSWRKSWVAQHNKSDWDGAWGKKDLRGIEAKPREDSSGVVTGEEAFSQRGVLGKMG